MADLWTPPRGFFPGTHTWFHPGNIARFQPILVSDSECDWDNVTKKITNVGTACVGGVVGKPVHIWYGDPPSLEAWGSVDACDGSDYHCGDVSMDTQSDSKMSIGTGVAAALADFFRAAQGPAPYGSACAIRYGWLFSDEELTWWRRLGFVMHWLGPP